MGGGNTQSSRGTQGIGTISPVGAGLANLFGGSIQNLPGGGQTTSLPNMVLPSVFQPQDFQGLSDLTSTLNPIQFDLGQFGTAGQNAANTLGEAAQTGLIDPARELFRQQFGESIAGLQEQFGGFGLGPNDSDFQAAALREAQMGSAQLADLAQNRRLQASQILPDTLSGLLGVEQGARGAERARTAGGQQLDLLNTLAGIQSGAAGIGTNRSSGKGWNVL